MIEGAVTDDGVPQVAVPVAGKDWTAVIDTGFNGYLELPDQLRRSLNSCYLGLVESVLAADQRVEEDAYAVAFPFDGEIVEAEVTFVSGRKILIGTSLLMRHRLEINFATRTVLLERTA